MSLLIHKPDRGIKERLSKYSLSYQYVKLHMNMMYDCTCIVKGLHVYCDFRGYTRSSTSWIKLQNETVQHITLYLSL